jgi:hypothetical protein
MLQVFACLHPQIKALSNMSTKSCEKQCVLSASKTVDNDAEFASTTVTTQLIKFEMFQPTKYPGENEEYSRGQNIRETNFPLVGGDAAGMPPACLRGAEF